MDGFGIASGLTGWNNSLLVVFRVWMDLPAGVH